MSALYNINEYFFKKSSVKQRRPAEVVKKKMMAKTVESRPEIPSFYAVGKKGSKTYTYHDLSGIRFFAEKQAQRWADSKGIELEGVHKTKTSMERKDGLQARTKQEIFLEKQESRRFVKGKK